MKYICVILFVAAVCAAPVDDHDHVTTEVVEDVAEKVVTKRPKVVEILESDNVHSNDGSYSFHYRGEDGSFREETAVIKNAGSKNQFLEVNGSYSFIDANGNEVVVHYTADDHGFVPVGNNIPDAISVAARENSQLPSMSDDLEGNDSVEELIPLKKISN